MAFKTIHTNYGLARNTEAAAGDSVEPTEKP